MQARARCAGAFGALVDRIPALHGAGVACDWRGRVDGGTRAVPGRRLDAFALIERAGVPLWDRSSRWRVGSCRFEACAALGLGALWGWMPCGLVYAALGLALGTGSASTGALTMVAFGRGTLPTLLTMGALATRLALLLRVTWVRRAAGVVIVAFGLLHVVAASAQIARGPSAPHTCCTGSRETER